MRERVRRANAGSKLEQLIAEQSLLNDEDAQYFAEKDDDEDFRSSSDESAVSDNDSENNESSTLPPKKKAKKSNNNSGEDANPQSGESGESDNSDGSLDDFNFTDSSDNTDAEEYAEPADIGEKMLAKQERQAKRDKRKQDQQKMFVIKKRVEKPKPKKKKVFTSADILLDKNRGRHSERRSALRHKQHLIEQMKEAEARRALYVPPKRKTQPKLTQEQRLEEAKKTELKNLASLNKFVELEEERKHNQRLAMLSRRPKLTEFIRFQSSQYFAKVLPTVRLYRPPPRPEIVNQGMPLGAPIKPVNSPSQVPPQAPSQVPSQSNTVPQGPTSSATATVKPELSKDSEKNGETTNTKPTSPLAQPNSKPAAETSEQSKQQETDEKPKEKNTDQAEPPKPETKTEANTDTSDKPLVVKTEPNDPTNETKSNETHQDEQSTDIKPQPQPQPQQTQQPPTPQLPSQLPLPPPPVDTEPYGPQQLKSYNFLSLHDFPQNFNKFQARNVVLGPVASTISHPPPKRICPFTGRFAKFLDPQSGIAYYDLSTYKQIQKMKRNELEWSRELGGVFTYNPQIRPASGVPEGF